MKVEKSSSKFGSIKIAEDGSYLQVDEVRRTETSSCSFDQLDLRRNFVLFFSEFRFVRQTGKASKLAKAQITLNDCLACSGCITSAETVLITQQSSEELYKVLRANSELVSLKWRSLKSYT